MTLFEWRYRWALLRRWWYLLRRGMWRGERAVNIRDTDGSIVLLATAQDTGMAFLRKNMRVWWHDDADTE